MPHLGVNTLRWLLFVVNLAALAGLGFLSWSLFVPGAGDQLRIGLPDPAEVAISAEVRETFDARVLNQLLRVHKDAPRAKPEPRPVEAAPPPLVEGGPLSGWEVAVAIIAEGRSCASLQERVQQNILPTSQQRVQPPDPRGGRARPSTARPRPVTQRRITPQIAAKTKWVIEGNEFRVDGNAYEALRITVAPSELEYRDLATGRSYKLSGAIAPWPGYEPLGRGGIALRGLTDEELGADPNQPAAAAQNAVSPDERGEVRRAAEPPAPTRNVVPAASARESADRNEKIQEIERMKMSEEDRRAVKDALQGAGDRGEKPQ